MGTLNLKTASGGSVILNPVNTATDVTITVPASNATMLVSGTSLITSGTAVASTSGTNIDFTGIPSWAKRITVMFNNVSTNGTAHMQAQIGTSSGFHTTGYLGSYGYGQAPNFNLTTGFGIYSDLATDMIQGSFVLNCLDSATGIWTFNSLLGWSSRPYQLPGAGSKTLSGILDRVRITTVTGTSTFDSGLINISYE
jgi:hypothetical protein